MCYVYFVYYAYYVCYVYYVCFVRYVCYVHANHSWCCIDDTRRTPLGGLSEVRAHLAVNSYQVTLLSYSSAPHGVAVAVTFALSVLR